MLGLRRLAADRWRHIPTPVRPHGRFHSLDRAQWRNDFDWFSFPFGRRRRRPNKRSRSLAHFVRWRHRNGQRGENFSLFFFFIFFFIFFLRFLLLKIFRFGARPPRTAKVRMSADLLRGLWLVDATPERKPWPKLFRTTRKKKRMFQADPVHNSIFFRTSATRSNEWTSSRPSFRSDDALLSSIDFRCEVSFLLSTYNWNVIDRPIEWSRVVVVDVFFFFFKSNCESSEPIGNFNECAVRSFLRPSRDEWPRRPRRRRRRWASISRCARPIISISMQIDAPWPG